MKMCCFYNIIHTLAESAFCVVVDTFESIEYVAQFCNNYELKSDSNSLSHFLSVLFYFIFIYNFFLVLNIYFFYHFWCLFHF